MRVRNAHKRHLHRGSGLGEGMAAGGGAGSSPFSGMIATQRARSHSQLIRRPMQVFFFNVVLLPPPHALAAGGGGGHCHLLQKFRHEEIFSASYNAVVVERSGMGGSA